MTKLAMQFFGISLLAWSGSLNNDKNWAIFAVSFLEICLCNRPLLSSNPYTFSRPFIFFLVSLIYLREEWDATIALPRSESSRLKNTSLASTRKFREVLSGISCLGWSFNSLTSIRSNSFLDNSLTFYYKNW